mmetsp:Transcript_131653/g.380811  ORF Transcript_131653/g.380811 Transcript_131653/m.380811 type:complete len:230 (-) Transcript_131653:530-1219(-)
MLRPEPGRLRQLGDGRARRCRLRQRPGDKVPSVGAHSRPALSREVQRARGDGRCAVLALAQLKREVCGQEQVDDDARAPDIRRRPKPSVPYLRSHVQTRPGTGHRLHIARGRLGHRLRQEPRQAEVQELDRRHRLPNRLTVELASEAKVLWLHIPVNQADPAMQEGESGKDLLCQGPCLKFVHWTNAQCKKVEQVRTLQILHEDVHLPRHLFKDGKDGHHVRLVRLLRS